MKNSFCGVLKAKKEGLKMVEKEHQNKVIPEGFCPGSSTQAVAVVKQESPLFNKQPTTRVEDPETSSGILNFITTKNYGFTLIELLVVVLIIGILAAVALPQYQKAVWKSKGSRLLPLINHIRQVRTLHLLAGGSENDSLLDMGFDYAVTGEGKRNETETFDGPYFTLQHVGSSYAIYLSAPFYLYGNGDTWSCVPDSMLGHELCASLTGSEKKTEGGYPLK